MRNKDRLSTQNILLRIDATSSDFIDPVSRILKFVRNKYNQGMQVPKDSIIFINANEHYFTKDIRIAWNKLILTDTYKREEVFKWAGWSGYKVFSLSDIL